MSRRSLYELADEVRVRPDTSVWTGKFDLNTDTCGGDSKISGYVWTGPKFTNMISCKIYRSRALIFDFVS